MKDNNALVKEGVPGLLSAPSFKTAWTDYQGWVVQKLNEKTAGTQLEFDDPKTVLLKTAREPAFAATFNYASMAFNNHFFFKGITRDEQIAPPSHTLTAAIDLAFSSMDTLRAEFLATAEVMFGPGFVWLVEHQPRESRAGLRILATYLAGSPLPGAHYREQSQDLNTQDPSYLAGLSQAEYARQTTVQNTAGVYGQHSTQRSNQSKLALGGAEVTPLLCVNTWEHVWLGDYGVEGKRKYLENWWDRIDWSVVNQLASVRPTNKFMGR